MSHKYIAFEGLDGAGKDTQKNLAHQYIQDKDKYAFVRQMREPSKYTESGRKLAELLKGNILEVEDKDLKMELIGIETVRELEKLF